MSSTLPFGSRFSASAEHDAAVATNGSPMPVQIKAAAEGSQLGCLSASFGLNAGEQCARVVGRVCWPKVRAGRARKLEAPG